MPWRLSWVTVRMSLSTALEKSTDDWMHYCSTPVSTLKGSVRWSLCVTRHSKISYKAWVMLTNCCTIQWCCRIFQSDGRCWLSKVFTTSTNAAYKELFHSCDWSMICWSTRKWSMHDVPSLKPACSRSSSFFTAVMMRWGMMRQKTLQVMDSSVMPLQLLHTD